jgi:hypothetical protein
MGIVRSRRGLGPGGLGRAWAVWIAVSAAVGCGGGTGRPTGAGGSGGAARADSGAAGAGGGAGRAEAGAEGGSDGPGITDGGDAPADMSSDAPQDGGDAAAGAGGMGAGGAAGTGGAGGGTGTGGAAGMGGAGGTGGAGGPDAGTGGADAAGCQTLTLTFAPQIPTVLVLVDRSGSEFVDATSGTFFTVRSAVLPVIQQVQAHFRMGLGVFTGQNPVSCPIFDTTPIAINNYGAIAATYGALGEPAFKAETPAVEVLPLVGAALQADPGTGQKYVLFITSGVTDFCNDGDPTCPADAVTKAVQDLRALTPSIATVVVGLPAAIPSPMAPSVLQNLANAGAGQAVAVPAGGSVTTQQGIYFSCSATGPWMSLYSAAGRTGTVPLATYAAQGGTATVFSAVSGLQQDVTDQVQAALASMKACTFDVAGAVKVDLTQLAQAQVRIQGVEVPHDNTSGWRMTSETQLQLVGSACATWRAPASDSIDFQFPCNAIVPL